jgi:RNA polymerase sigma factor (sigma-70 family)
MKKGYKLRELFTKYYPHLVGLGVGRFKDEDLVREALQVIYLKLPDEDSTETSHTKGYFINAMRNECLTLLKQTPRTEPFDSNKHETADDSQNDEQDEDANDIDHLEYKIRLDNCVAYLKDHGAINQKEETLLKMKLNFRKHKEIADAIGASEKYVAVIWSRLIEKIQKIQHLATVRNEPA